MQLGGVFADVCVFDAYGCSFCGCRVENGDGVISAVELRPRRQGLRKQFCDFVRGVFGIVCAVSTGEWL